MSTQTTFTTPSPLTCPFCGKWGVSINQIPRHQSFRANCNHCHAEGPPMPNGAMAMGAWNKRGFDDWGSDHDRTSGEGK